MLKCDSNERALPLIYTLQVASLKTYSRSLGPTFLILGLGPLILGSNLSIKIIIEIIYFVFTLNYNTLITSLYYLPFKIS
jgi:hypothetical protein